jgi:hypothetical protein
MRIPLELNCQQLAASTRLPLSIACEALSYTEHAISGFRFSLPSIFALV